ncbi:YpmA family protein [Thermodesulfitimonas autotrophica]|uniref:YpmA family protein n=1 Tax=Thermodesulfitimonas autotrophica TaxID=1894989 RepID=UPI002FE416E6
MKEEEVPKLTLIATRSFKECEELYRVVDFLNKTLKEKRVLFGLTKDSAKGEMTISIYET